MVKSTKYIIVMALAIPLLLTGCDDLFDKGDTEKAYDGPDTVAFKPETTELDEGNSQTIEIQLISSEGVATSDVQVEFGVDNEATSADSEYYTVPSSPVTISSGSTSTSITVETSNDPDLASGEEATLTLTINSASGAEVAENINTSTIFIQGVD